MQQYTVTGMHCAACSASVEKAVKKVPGVTSCAVSLLTNSMGVEGTAEPAAVIKAVRGRGLRRGVCARAGGRSCGGRKRAGGPGRRRILKQRLIASAAFSAHSDVFLDGPHDVGLAAARLVWRQPRRHGSCPAAAGRDRHGHQPGVLRERLPRASCAARRTWTRSSRSARRRPSGGASYALFAMTDAQLHGGMRSRHGVYGRILF